MAKGGADWQTGYRHGLEGKTNQPPSSVKFIEDYSDGYAVGKKEKADRETFRNSTPYQNGRDRATVAIENAMAGGGRVVNAEKVIAFQNPNEPKGPWFVGTGFGKSSYGYTFKTQVEAQRKADQINKELVAKERREEADRELTKWKSDMHDKIKSGEVRRWVRGY